MYKWNDMLFKFYMLLFHLHICVSLWKHTEKFPLVNEKRFAKEK